MTALPGLLEWFESRRSAYPWRRPALDPYAVLVSEFMLQQTQAARVAPAFDRFMERFPTVYALAAAPAAEVIRAWSGLGYNRRAVALSGAARAVVANHRGRIPADPAALRTLPGVGPYTAAAVASFAYGRPVAALDTNLRRVLARVFHGADAAEVALRTLEETARDAIDRADPGGWNQALMDLGREVCRPVPRCDACPVAAACRWAAAPHGVGAGRRRSPRPETFAGSNRQVRGAVVRELSRAEDLTPAALAGRTGFDLERVAQVVQMLSAEGLVESAPRGRVRLAESAPQAVGLSDDSSTARRSPVSTS